MATDLEIGIRMEVPGHPGRSAGHRRLADPAISDRSSAKAPTKNSRWKATVPRPASAASGASSTCPTENPDEFPEIVAVPRGEVPQASGAVLPRTGPPHDFRHGQREQPLRPGRRADRADRRPDHRRRHRRPPPGAAARPGQGRRRPRDHPTARSSPRVRCNSSNGPWPTARTRSSSPRATTTCSSRASGRRSIRRLVEGRFPKWRDVFPRTETDDLASICTVGPFYSAVRQAAIVTSENHRGVDFTFGDGKIVLTGARRRNRRVPRRIAHRLRRTRTARHPRSALRQRLPQSPRSRIHI